MVYRFLAEFISYDVKFNLYANIFNIWTVWSYRCAGAALELTKVESSVFMCLYDLCEERCPTLITIMTL